MPVNSAPLPSDQDESSMPIYARIQRHFLDLIATGGLRVGDRLPTEKEIASDFDTSRATVQNAMSRLVYEGWIEKKAGSGTFVAHAGRSATIDLDDVRSFEEDVVMHGTQVRYRLLTFGRELADEEVASRIGTDPGTTVFAFERLRMVGEAIVGLERRFFAPGIVLDFPVDALDSQSTHALVQHGLKLDIGRMDASIRAIAADKEMARKLLINPGSPLLLRRHTMFTAAGDVILFGEAVYCEPFAFRYTARTHHEI